MRFITLDRRIPETIQHGLNILPLHLPTRSLLTC